MITEQELKELVGQAKEATKKKLAQSITDSACTQARDHIQRAVQKVCTEVISDTFRQELSKLLEGEKPLILEEVRKSVNLIAKQFGDSLLLHVTKQLETSWQRSKFFESIFKY